MREKNRWYDSMWDVCVLSAAIHDWDLFDKIRTELPDHGRVPLDATCNRVLYEKLLSILRGTYPLPEHEDFATPSETHKNTLAMLRCLDCIAQGESHGFCDSLSDLMSIRRRSIGLDPGDRLICMLAHGLWEIAALVDSALVKDWDVRSRLPWDADLHAFTRSIESSRELIHRLELSSEFQEAISLQNMRPSLD